MRSDELATSCLLVVAGLGLAVLAQRITDSADVHAEPPSEGLARNKRACHPSVTTVNGKQACHKEVVFLDNFDTGIDENKWRKDLMIAGSPDYEFVAYYNKGRNSFVRNGTLHLKPTILDEIEETALSGRLDFRNGGCTGASQDQCFLEASAFNILPPVISARIKTTQSFSFKYGVVEVRAKFPEGNWLFPEIWLEPLEQAYGAEYRSGRMVVGMARGNAQLLTNAGQEIGSRLLQGGAILTPNEPGRSLYLKSLMADRDAVAGWNEAFHVYKLDWKPDGIVVSVDDKVYGTVIPPSLGGFGLTVENNRWEEEGGALAPFDVEFYLTLGLGVGGVREFPDHTTTGGHPKPWKNTAAKARLDFLRDRKNWKNSWVGENAALQVDYIKVTAL